MFTSYMRITYVVLAWLLVPALIAQVFFAGIGVFAGSFTLHIIGATVIGILVLLLVPTALAARVPRRSRWLVGLLFVDMLLQGLLVDQWHRGGPALLAALHPVNALVLFCLAGYVALQSRALLGAADQRPEQVTVEHAAA